MEIGLTAFFFLLLPQAASLLSVLSKYRWDKLASLIKTLIIFLRLHFLTFAPLSHRLLASLRSLTTLDWADKYVHIYFVALNKLFYSLFIFHWLSYNQIALMERVVTSLPENPTQSEQMWWTPSALWSYLNCAFMSLTLLLTVKPRLPCVQPECGVIMHSMCIIHNKLSAILCSFWGKQSHKNAHKVQAKWWIQ